SLYQRLLLIRRARVSMILDKLPKQIRQLSMELGKEVGLQLIGSEIEVDRNVLLALQEPLIHLLRNSMDHGIEDPQTRRNQNKPSQGTIVIQASVDNSSFVLTIEDDGRGIDKDQILKKAIDKGLARQDRDYTDEEIYGFLFASGFSTAETISNVSGRGVGLDSVSHTIKRLGGKIEIQSTKGKGSQFCLTVPQNEGVKTRRLILLVCANQQFAIKESEVLEIVDSAKLGVLKQSDGIAMYRDSVISYLNLVKLFQLNSLNQAETFKAMVIVQIKTIRFGLLVDKIVQTLDAVIEPIQNKKLNQNQFFEGTVAIGSKAPILVLNLKNLVAVYSSNLISPDADRID
ncbi:MAG: chemotaxis protein CheW, partial [Candidatus Cloacimonetes bacterium]|nr:chemotaxis protein CheW [Candidatus Cloacimonadota bacterium]